MIDKKQTVAVIIPAHNEALNIGTCIESLLNQTMPVDEIIVVSNACADETSDIVRNYPSVKLIETDVKSLINARNIGFDAAKSDILARINADVECSSNWSEYLINTFKSEDISAVSGVAKTMTLPFWPYLYTAFWSRIYIYFAEAYFGVPILWGANMAITKNAWLDIRDSACSVDSEVHEDQDLSLHLAEKYKNLKFQTKLIVRTSEKSYFEWSKFHKYNLIRKNTKSMHLDLLKRTRPSRLSYVKRAWRLIVIAVPGTIFYTLSRCLGIISKLLHR